MGASTTILYAAGSEAAGIMNVSAADGPKDPVRIDVSDRDEVARWSALLECSEAELRRAVAAAGPLAERVRHYLARQKPPANDPCI